MSGLRHIDSEWGNRKILWLKVGSEVGLRVPFPDILIMSMVGCGVDSLDRTESSRKIGPRGI